MIKEFVTQVIAITIGVVLGNLTIDRWRKNDTN